MSGIYELIRKFNNDPDVIELKNYYSSLSLMEILGVTRDERVHSSFLAWLFDSNINFDLRTKPLMLLLDLLIQEDEKDKKNNFPVDNRNDIILRIANIIPRKVKKEYPIDKDGRVDIYIQFDIDDNQYAIIIENKVESKENKETKDKRKGMMQTEKYYNHFKNDKSKMKYIYVFLSPYYGGNKVKAHDEHFLNISYSDIVNSIINPILADNNLSEKTRIILEDYLKVLSKPNVINPDSNSISLATSKYEDSLINNIETNNHELGLMLLNDDENDIIKEFISNNQLVVSSVWPGSIRKRNRNRTFAELGIEPGTILYLSKSEQSNERDTENRFVKTIDELNQVEYTTIDGKVVTRAISTMAKELTKKTSINGFRWFIYNDGTEDINLSRIERKN